ncbi:MAG: adenylyl-sulfate kinase [Acidimicrobiales bacterium]
MNERAKSPNVTLQSRAVSREQRWRAMGGDGATVWFTGLSGSGKSTVAVAVEKALVAAGRACYLMDGDNLRHGINGDLGFSPGDRAENIRRVSEIARLFADAGVVALVPVISPYRADRDASRALHEQSGLHFVEVFVDTPLEICVQRDPKGLYKKARAGEISDFTGIDAPYEAPLNADVILRTDEMELDLLVSEVLNALG